MYLQENAPSDRLNIINRKYSKGYDLIEEFRKNRGRDIPNWPKWCFLPMAGFYPVISKAIGSDRTEQHFSYPNPRLPFQRIQ